ncbi:MAG: DUF4058 family protein [Gemmataceae bacterium]|nr:DUF4058 family protein [Gemmataceae bacterium]
MAIHDWTLVDDGIFHHQHLRWISELSGALNDGLLPSGFYALGEAVAGGAAPDVLTLREPDPPSNGDVGGPVALAVAAPRVSLVAEAEREAYTHRQRSIVIRHRSNHRLVAMIEVVSAGNKGSEYSYDTFLDKALGSLRQGIHLLILDLHPPTPRDPNGVHGALWGALNGTVYNAPADRPLTLAAYSAGEVKRAYVEPCAVGSTLIDMPLFLTPEQYINVPLESTYMEAYRGVPRFYRDILERA